MSRKAEAEYRQLKLREVFQMTQSGWEFLGMPNGLAKWLRSPEGEMWVVVKTLPGGCEICREEKSERYKD